MILSGAWTLKLDLIALLIVLISVTGILVILSPFVLNIWLKNSIEINARYALTVFGFVTLIGLLLYFVALSIHFLLDSPSQPHENTVETGIDQEQKENETKDQTSIYIEGKNHGESVVIPKENLVYISTQGHYVHIFLIESKKSELKKIVFRNSIASIAHSLQEHTELIHCHRSHLINLRHVKQIIGSSKKMEAVLKNVDNMIPISRTKASLVNEKLKEFNFLEVESGLAHS